MMPTPSGLVYLAHPLFVLTIFFFVSLGILGILLRKRASFQIEKFLALLGQLTTSRHKEFWSFDDDGRFRMFSTTNLWKEMSPQPRFCPITWVCYQTSYVEFSHRNFGTLRIAASRIGLSDGVMRRIVRVVDTRASYLKKRKDRELRYRIQRILEIPSTMSN